MTETYRSPDGGFEYSVGMIFAHLTEHGVYARVEGFEPERDAILFSVWEIHQPGWQEGAGLPTSDFAWIYRDGPYKQDRVDAATEDHRARPAIEILRTALVTGGTPGDAEMAGQLIENALAEHRRILAAYLTGWHDGLPKSSPTRRGLKVAVHRVKEWKMSPAQSAPEGDQTTT